MSKKTKKPGHTRGKIINNRPAKPGPATDLAPNPYLKAAVLEVVENQIQNLNPPQTRQTYDRLIAAGYNDEDARKLIGQVVVVEIFEVMKYQRPYDEARYLAALNRLPETPF